MICSTNEIGSTVTAAARGSGHPIGLARELGAATVALCGEHIENATDALDAALRACAPPERDNPELEIRERRARWSPSPVIRVAPSAFELLVAGHVDTVLLEDVDVPELLDGYASVATRRHATTFVLDGPHADGIMVTRIGTGAGAETATGRTGGGVVVDDATWAELRRLSARTLVPASEESRLRGAGTGDLTDND